MIWTLVSLFAFCALGIVFLTIYATGKEKTLEEFLKSLAEYWEGDWGPINEYPNSYRVSFNFEGQSFVYEDAELPGFNGQIRRGYFKTQSNSKLSLQFTEIQRTTTVIQPDILLMSKIANKPIPQTVTVKMPKKLKDFRVYTSDPQTVNTLMQDSKFVDILAEFKNLDHRGYPFLPIKIVDGMIVLELYSEKRYKPNRLALIENISLAEDYIEILLTLTQKLNRLSQI